MGAKKDAIRYTIKFNPANPRHKKAMQILDESGERRKASLIADALCMYSRYGVDMYDDLLTRDTSGINQVQHMDTTKLEAAKLSNATMTDEHNLWQSINESLAGFQ